MSNEQRGQEEDREYELTDLFGDEIRPQDQNMNPELERVRSAAARKAYDHSPVEGSPRAGGFPGAEQFKASAEEMGTRMPGIHLTSVEEEYRLAHPQTGDDTTGFIPEQPVPVTAVPVPQAQISPTEPVQVPRQSAEPEPREYATAYHGKYDYDYDAEETGYVSGSPEKQVSSPDMDPENTLQLQLAQALEQERRASRALEQKEEAQRLAREKKERTQRGLIIGIMGILALILVGAIIMILLPSGEDVLPVESSSTSSAVVRDQKTFSGIVTRVDREHGTMLVYNAEERNEKSFSTMDTTISLDDLEVGDMIDVVYDAASRDVLISIMSCAKAEKVEGITGIPVEGSTLSISQSSYTLDERLICTYNDLPTARRRSTPAPCSAPPSWKGTATALR